MFKNKPKDDLERYEYDYKTRLSAHNNESIEGVGNKVRNHEDYSFIVFTICALCIMLSLVVAQVANYVKG